MKRQFLIIITGLLITTSSLFAQKKDHALIGHLDGAELWVQNVNNIHEYTVITGPVKDDKMVSSIKVIGKTTMTAYKYEGENSAFGIIYNYKAFLEGKDFEILYSCKSGECGSNISKLYIANNKIETTDNSVSPAFSDASYFRNYLSAKKEENGKTIYVSIFIAQGWWSFPVYRIDVVEKDEKTSMILNDSPNQKNITVESTENQQTPLNDQTEKTKTNSISLQVGFGSYKFCDPQVYGEDVVIERNGIKTGTLKGFRELSGLYIKTMYFFNKNIGLSADLAIYKVVADNNVSTANTYTNYKSTVDLNFARVGVLGRFVGNEFPVKLAFSSGFGFADLSTYYFNNEDNGVTSFEYNYDGNTSFPIAYFQVEIAVPIFKGAFLFSEFEHTMTWCEDYTMVDENGTEHYSITYQYPGFGGNIFRAGLGYEFGGQ